jgi:8-oxo-dGTP pyrophosphatase MutT (NUDIX family)
MQAAKHHDPVLYEYRFRCAIILTTPRTTYADPEGIERTWESAERLTRPQGCDIDGVGVVAVLQDPAEPNAEPRILLQKQWRPPINQTVIEVPAGLMDPNETPEACAIRELKEETGYVGEVVKDKSFDVTPIMYNGKPVNWPFADSYSSRVSHWCSITPHLLLVWASCTNHSNGV